MFDVARNFGRVLPPGSPRNANSQDQTLGAVIGTHYIQQQQQQRETSQLYHHDHGHDEQQQPQHQQVDIDIIAFHQC